MAMPKLIVEFAPGDNWNVASPTWVDITNQIRNDRGFRIRRGRQTPFTRMRPSTLTLTLDNSNGDFDPDNSAGAYVNDLVPIVPIRVRAIHNATTHDLFRGFVTDWEVGQRDFSDTFTTVQAIDGLSLVQLYRLQSVWVQEVQADSPKAWYRFGESSGTAVVDASGNNHDGTYVGSTFTLGTANAAILGDANTAVSLDVEDYADLPDSARFTADPLTIEFWFKEVDQGGRGRRHLFNLSLLDENLFNDGPGEIRAWIEATSSHSLEWLVRSDDGSGYGITGSVPVNDGEWHHAVLTISGAGAGEAYLDGVSFGTGTKDLTLANPNNRMYVSIVHPQHDGQEFDGVVDELVLYDSELSTARVSAHYNAATAPWNADLTSARVTNVLSEVGWPSADRVLSTGESTMQNFLGEGATALVAIALAQDTEDSELWVAGDGQINFTNRHDRNVSAYAATFSNDTDGDTPYRDFRWKSDDQYLRNVAQVTNSDSVVTESRDSASVTKYAPRVVSRTSNSPTATEIADYADWLQAEFGTTRRRGILDLANGSVSTNDEWAEMLSRELGDLIKVENTPISGGTQNTWDLFIEEFSLNGTLEVWEMQLGLSPALRQRMFTLDDSILGKLDRDSQGLLGW